MDGFAEAAGGCGKEAISKKGRIVSGLVTLLGGRLRGDHTDDLTGADQKIPVKITFPRKLKLQLAMKPKFGTEPFSRSDPSLGLWFTLYQGSAASGVQMVGGDKTITGSSFLSSPSRLSLSRIHSLPACTILHFIKV